VIPILLTNLEIRDPKETGRVDGLGVPGYGVILRNNAPATLGPNIQQGLKAQPLILAHEIGHFLNYLVPLPDPNEPNPEPWHSNINGNIMAADTHSMGTRVDRIYYNLVSNYAKRN
jgi:hypothetical protein